MPMSFSDYEPYERNMLDASIFIETSVDQEFALFKSLDSTQKSGQYLLTVSQSPH